MGREEGPKESKQEKGEKKSLLQHSLLTEFRAKTGKGLESKKHWATVTPEKATVFNGSV